MSRPPLDNHKSGNNIKFLCGYGGRIVPRHPDGRLRYLGGHTRVLAVDRSITFPELLVKLTELCGSTMIMRCQLPTEDLDALVSIKSDEDLLNIIEEYDLVASPSSMKIKTFLWPDNKSTKPTSPPSEGNATSPPILSRGSQSPSPTISSAVSSPRYVPFQMPMAAFPICYGKSISGLDKFALPHNHHGLHDFHHCNNVYHLVHSGNHWQ